MEIGILEIIELVISLLFIAALVGIAVKRLRMPYTVGLVIMGLTLALFAPVFLDITKNITQESLQSILIPQLILGLLVPPLVFEAAFKIKFTELRRNIWIILLFAVVGVIVSMMIVGSLISLGTNLSLPVALVFGALIAATDPVAVVSLFKSLGVPHRIQVLLEGESLLNDGAAIVVFSLMLTVVETGHFNLVDAIAEFLVVALGGVIVGFLIGSLASFIIRTVNDSLIEITLTIVAAYGSYLLAEEFHFGGVLAVVVAGLVLGNVGPRGMSPTTRISLHSFWDYLAFLANSIVFLLVGIIIDLNQMFIHWYELLLALGVVLLARAVVIYGFSLFMRKIGKKTRHVLFWGGLRGAISLALVLSLPASIFSPGEVPLLQAMAFGIVLFTILVQGSTMPGLISKLKLNEKTESERQFQLNQARAVASQYAYHHLENQYEEGLISERAWELIQRPLKRQIKVRTDAVREIMQADRSVEVSELNNAFREAMIATRSKYNTLQADGALDEDNFLTLVAEVDTALSSNRISYADALLARGPDRPPITRLVTTTLLADDAKNVCTTLNVMGIPVTQYESLNKDIGKSVVTLIAGIEIDQEEEVIGAITNCCTDEPAFNPSLIRNFLPVPPDKEVGTGNSMIYIFDIEHFEEI